jgi:CBS domain containing-hemolysin-like protein
VIGVVHMKDLWLHLLDDRSNRAFELSAQTPIRVARNHSQEEVLGALQAGRGQLALVQAEGGAIVGLCTLEDVIESLVGNVRQHKPLAPARSSKVALR